MYPYVENMIVVPITKWVEIIMRFQVWLSWWMNFDYKEKVERKAFLANSNHQYHVSQWGEHDCSAHKKKEWRLLWVSMFVSFQEWTLITMKMVQRKAFLANPNINIVCPNEENMIVVPITKKMEITTSIHVCLISQMNINYKANGGKESFS